jgi:hypothetical protein
MELIRDDGTATYLEFLNIQPEVLNHYK